MVAEAPGSVRLALAPNVVLLNPEPAVSSAMKEGWARQQSARFLQASTIQPRLRLIQRFEEFTGLYPWQWTPADGEAFIVHLRSGSKPIQLSTARAYEVAIELFVEFLTIYAYGTRRTESSKVDLVDLRRHRKAPQFGTAGSMTVRYGKSSKGTPPKRRTVLLVPEMDWVVDVLDEWVHEIRPRLSPDRHPALWVTERVGRMSPRSINEAFVTARQDAGLDEDLDLHCLRHSYITHLTEFGYPARFVQEQVGHSHASTTAIYMGVSDEYRNQLLEASLKRRLGDDWDLK
ncbi:tyrosine-type recombinase/integrase [Streptomyces sp. NBC_01235]|uniref:tyrosine-type recombinase/integrase n=1 Tax=Streptomyces sp. NBC_01235 TaxID=2903788 RepID=UPI002E166C89|nr:tyrosine-type recombinase/integrase [Streptomyces sp. NBC_01235]